MNQLEFNKLRELSWRRQLSAVEEAQLRAYLASHPEDQAAWENEAALTHLLTQLPDTAVPSNFTAQVVQALDQQGAEQPVKVAFWQRFIVWLYQFLPRYGWATMALLVLALAYQGYRWQVQKQQRENQQGLGLILAAMPDEPAVFENFDAVRHLPQASTKVDEELWVALNQVASNP